MYCGMRLGVNTSFAILLMQLNIPMTILLAKFLFNEQISEKSLIGVILAFTGMMIVVGDPYSKGEFWAVILLLLSAFFCAIFNIQNRIFKRIPPLSLLCWTSLISTPHLFLLSYFLEGNTYHYLADLTFKGVFAVLYGSIIAGIIGNALWIYLLQSYPVNLVVPFNLLVPVFGISISILILKEYPSLAIIIGGLITLGGVAITQLRNKNEIG